MRLFFIVKNTFLTKVKPNVYFSSIAQITRLKIQGIRSFDSQHPEYISFHSPLTLIVGQNGCGKTSIIECLKYASTGQQPPNTKGGAFIHDPKLSGDKESIGHVKLEFLNASQNKLVVSRTMSLTAKKGGVTQKTLDCTLLMHNHGERHTMSTRVADMDRIVPAQMGVTAAVLDNVIFCHQDDSLWPMAEPQKLKEKFDKIFDAQKYTKAIENMIKMRKLHKEELGKLVIHEANNKAMKEKADRAQKRLLQLEDEIDSLREKIESYNTNIKLASEEAKKKKIASNKALGTVEELKNKKDRASGYQSFLATLKEDLEELQESDEWLQSTLDQYEARMTQYRLQSQEYQSQYAELERVLVVSRRTVAEKQTERGLHQAEKKSYEAQIETRDQLIKEFARKHAIKGFQDDLDECHVRKFMENMQKLALEKDRELDQARNSTKDELNQIQNELSKLETCKATRIQEKVNSKAAINTNEVRINTKQREANSIQVDEGAKVALEASLSDAQKRLDEANIQLKVMDWDKKIKSEDSNLRELELEANHLKDELFKSNKLAKDQAALEYAKTQAKNAQISLNAMIETFNERLIPVLSHDWSLNSLEDKFKSILSERSQALADTVRKRDLAEREYRDHEFKLSTQIDTLKLKINEIEKCEKVVLSSISTATGEPLKNVEAFLEELNSIEEECNELRQDLGSMSVVREYYEKSLVTVREQNCCRLCERKFVNTKEKALAEGKIEKLLKKYVEEQARKDLKILEEDLEKANAARPYFETLKKLKIEEIPLIQSEIKKLEAEKTKLVATCESCDNIVNDKMSEKQDVETLTNTVNDIVKYHKDNLRYQEEIKRLSSHQKSKDDCMTVEEIQKKSASCDEMLRVLRKKIENLTNDRNSAKSEIASLEIEVSNLMQKLSLTQFQLEKKKALLATIEEHRENSKNEREAMRKVDQELESLTPQFTKFKVKYADIQRRGETKAKEIHAEKDKLSQSINRLKMIETVIEKYIEDGGPERLTACDRELRDLEQDQQRTEIKLSQVTENATELNSQITDSEKIKRSILSNIRYRKTLRDLDATNKEVLILEERIVHEDADRLVQEHLTAEKHGQDLMAERGPLVGQMSAKDNELTALIKEWETDYKDASQKYRETHIKVETTKAAIEDIIKCTHAVDNAIMKYHTLKMEQINTIAGDMWTSTYQGTDIDTIMIRSENENNSTSLKRNYNYRLCMLKQDAELDMRGRCSAGQRVLASIIIRLALAECFGVSCGVIALDEPTTNLDRENINALAESLNRIIRARKSQSNFQLIIITHDEEFLQAMKCSEFTDIFWHVSRDVHQKSTIKMESLKDNN
ncbi:DNA repair protein RAD50 [Golovinomyces cichoracearum]|uniref:DNA repair protein RAD50 n=1 Tax=Golovinomyces cichoracearum TaxID=62708 RepID=A0A420IF10_9PEZI|nr:DNA repair protein RAD50 [Golovinomyces cichoracearum]